MRFRYALAINMRRRLVGLVEMGKRTLKKKLDQLICRAVLLLGEFFLAFNMPAFSNLILC